jgi:hypothetical protein
MTALEREIETGRWKFPCQAKRTSEFRNNTRHEEKRDKNSKYSDVTHHEPTRHFRLRYCHVTWWRMTWVDFCDVTRTTALTWQKRRYVPFNTSLRGTVTVQKAMNIRVKDTERSTVCITVWAAIFCENCVWVRLRTAEGNEQDIRYK